MQFHWPFVRRSKVAAVLAELREVQASLDSWKASVVALTIDRDFFHVSLVKAQDEVERLRVRLVQADRVMTDRAHELGRINEVLMRARRDNDKSNELIKDIRRLMGSFVRADKDIADGALSMGQPMGLKRLS
jgi:hypothetical protein